VGARTKGQARVQAHDRRIGGLRGFRQFMVPRHDPGAPAKRHRLEGIQPARSQSSSATARKLTPDQSRPLSNASSAASSASALVSASNSAVSTSSFHNGSSPTPGSRIARSLLVSASASSRVTDSAPRSSSAFS
jgi:hypothetical protein